MRSASNSPNFVSPTVIFRLIRQIFFQSFPPYGIALFLKTHASSDDKLLAWPYGTTTFMSRNVLLQLPRGANLMVGLLVVYCVQVTEQVEKDGNKAIIITFLVSHHCPHQFLGSRTNFNYLIIDHMNVFHDRRRHGVTKL